MEKELHERAFQSGNIPFQHEGVMLESGRISTKLRKLDTCLICPFKALLS